MNEMDAIEKHLQEGNEISHALEAVQAHIRKGIEIRELLEEELKTIEARAAEIRAVIARLASETSMRQSRKREQRKITEVIAQIVASSHGVMIGEIVKGVQAVKYVEPDRIYPNVYRMTRDGRLVKVDGLYYVQKQPNGVTDSASEIK